MDEHKLYQHFRKFYPLLIIFLQASCQNRMTYNRCIVLADRNSCKGKSRIFSEIYTNLHLSLQKFSFLSLVPMVLAQVGLLLKRGA